MFKKSTIIQVLAWAFIVSLVFSMQPGKTFAKSLKTSAESAMILDVDTGKILYDKNADEPLPPASMTKMMTEYLVLEKIDQGELNWDDEVEISDYAYKISGNIDFSGVGLYQNKTYNVKELYEAMAINSDNATTIALAEKIAGSETEFVKMMNKKAEELELPDYKFVNSTGLDNDTLGDDRPDGTKKKDSNLMSARTSALLGYHLVQDYPESLEFSSIAKTKFDGQEITNWNWMLDHNSDYLKQFRYKGIDGLKTGNTKKAGYTFTGTAERDGKRLISVVMKTKSEAERFNETAKLLDYGFENFEEVELFPAGYEFNQNELPVQKGKTDSVKLATKEPIKSTIKKGTEDDYSLAFQADKNILDEDGNLTAPIKESKAVGLVSLKVDGDEDFGYILDKDKNYQSEVVTLDEVEKKSWFSLFFGSIGNFFSGLTDKIKDVF